MGAVIILMGLMLGAPVLMIGSVANGIRNKNRGYFVPLLFGWGVSLIIMSLWFNPLFGITFDSQLRQVNIFGVLALLGGFVSYMVVADQDRRKRREKQISAERSKPSAWPRKKGQI